MKAVILIFKLALVHTYVRIMVKNNKFEFLKLSVVFYCP